ncbi:MAG: hypothetical protein ACK5IJ_03645 [Mangrovibacterium sp.]
MFFIGFISTIVPYLLMIGVFLAALYQLNGNDYALAEDLLQQPEIQYVLPQNVSIADELTSVDVCCYIDSLQNEELRIKIPEAIVLEFLLLNTCDYQSIEQALYSGLSPPCVI